MLSAVNKPNIAVLLAAYNGESWLQSQLNSILNQQDVDVTIFVSVDRSVDGTEDWFNRLAEKDDRVKILPHGQCFGSAALNFFRLIRDVDIQLFDYISFSDQDDIWLPDKLSRAVMLMQQGNYAAYSSNVTAFWPDGREQFIDKAQPQRRKDFLFEAAGPGSTYVFNTTLAQDLQNFIALQRDKIDQVSLHDWFFYAFARSQQSRWLIDSRPGLLYRQHAANHLGVNAGITAFKDRLKRISSGWYRGEVLKIASLCCSQNDPFFNAINSGGWRSRLFMMRHIGQCRRRFLDRLILFFCCLFGVF